MSFPRSKLEWRRHNHPVKFQLGDKVFFCSSLPLLACEVGLAACDLQAIIEQLPVLADDCAGYLIRSLPIAAPLPAFTRQGSYLRHASPPYPRYYIDLGGTFADYRKKFSAKTRSTLSRKVKKFAAHCGGELQWKVYRSRSELMEFHRLARSLSVNTYQEKLLDAGIPDGKAFLARLANLAETDAARGYLLFHGEVAVAYLCCPIKDGAVEYEYLGYDPAYRDWSVGTILQLLALESIFEERKWRVFDFTQGESEHKRMFGTGSVLSADIYILRNTFRNAMLMRARHQVNRLSGWLGALLDRHGLKARARRALRFGE